MSAPALDIMALLPSEPFERAWSEVNEWRGRCQNALALAETAATRCLQSLARVPGRGSKVAFPTLVGARYELLTALLTEGGAFAAEAGRAVQSLAALREHDRLRIALCHGLSEISLDRRGRWTLVLSVLAVRSGAVSPDLFLVREAEAEPVFDDLNRTAQRLSSVLGQVVGRLRPGPHIEA